MAGIGSSLRAGRGLVPTKIVNREVSFAFAKISSEFRGRRSDRDSYVHHQATAAEVTSAPGMIIRSGGRRPRSVALVMAHLPRCRFRFPS